MNKITLTLAVSLLSGTAIAQVAIGKQSVNGTSTLLDFDDSPANTKGIILSALETLPALNADNNGTFLFDKSDSSVKMYENGVWVSLTDRGNNEAFTSDSRIVNTSDEVGSGAIIGNSTSNAMGALILESPDKAMILPKITNPHTTVKSPYPGMICYDTASKSLAIFDGTRWNYWK